LVVEVLVEIAAAPSCPRLCSKVVQVFDLKLACPQLQGSYGLSSNAVHVCGKNKKKLGLKINSILNQKTSSHSGQFKIKTIYLTLEAEDDEWNFLYFLRGRRRTILAEKL